LTQVSQSEVGWVISLVGKLTGRPNPKKPTTLRGALGFGTAKAVVASGAV